MPFGNFSLEELARYLGQDARELKRWAERGQMPGMMVGGKWRFNRAEMLDWAQSQMHKLDERVVHDLERAMIANSKELLISSLLPTKGVNMLLPARSAGSVLRELTNLAHATELLYDADTLLRALQDREALCSTALPKGVALPHPRRPLPYAIAEPFICLAHVPAGVPFSAPDGKLTDLFVLICCQDEQEHLQVLARLAVMLSDSQFVENLRGIVDRDAAITLLTETENRLRANRK
ncbi:MAG: PTS sugar transporter subunit IIA [Phycisphaerae bacterium]